VCASLSVSVHVSGTERRSVRCSASGSESVSGHIGKQVKVQSLSLGNNEIDITGLSKGFYLVSITTKGGKQTQKLVVE
jgi:hypothetical protein